VTEACTKFPSWQLLSLWVTMCFRHSGCFPTCRLGENFKSQTAWHAPSGCGCEHPLNGPAVFRQRFWEHIFGTGLVVATTMKLCSQGDHLLHPIGSIGWRTDCAAEVGQKAFFCKLLFEYFRRRTSSAVVESDAGMLVLARFLQSVLLARGPRVRCSRNGSGSDACPRRLPDVKDVWRRREAAAAPARTHAALGRRVGLSG